MTIKTPSPRKKSKGYQGKGNTASKRKDITTTEGETQEEAQPSSKKQHTGTEAPLEEESGLIKEPVIVTQSQATPSKPMGAIKGILKTATTNTPTKKLLEAPKTPLKSPSQQKQTPSQKFSRPMDTKSYKPTPQSTPYKQKRPSEHQQTGRTPLQHPIQDRPLERPCDRPVERLREVNRSRSRERHIEVPLQRPRGEREGTYMPKEVQRDWFQEREGPRDRSRERDRSRDRERPVHLLSTPDVEARQGITSGRAFERGPERSHPRELNFERTDEHRQLLQTSIYNR